MKKIFILPFIPLLYIGYLLVGTGFFIKYDLYSIVKYSKEKKREIFFQSERPRYWIKINQLNKKVKWPILLSEDWAFFEHDGYDWSQIKKVVSESVSEGGLSRGASTISQQLVKNLYLNQSRSLFRKFNEFILTFFLERMCSKEWILEQYVNMVELGPGVHVIGNASLFYFNKKQHSLNYREGAFLAMLLPSPKKYSQSFFQKKLSSFAGEQVFKIVSKLALAKIITEEEVLTINSVKFYWEQSTQPLEPLREDNTVDEEN